MSLTREILDVGSFANDPSADTPRSGSIKINNNLGSVYWMLGGDSSQLTGLIRFDSDAISFEGNIIDANETRLVAVNPTAVRTISLPNASGTVVLNSTADTLTNKTLTSPVLDKPQINDSNGSFQYIIKSAGALAADRTISLPILGANDTFTFNAATQTLTNKTLTSPTISNPGISGAIKDVNGASMVSLTATGSAILNFTMSNAATGGSPALGVTGTDSDVDMFISAKNRGAVRFSKAAYQSVTMTAAGTIPRSRTFIDLNSGVGIAATLANGSITGEFKILANRGAGTVTVTPTSFAQGTSFALAQNEACEVIWNGTSWFLCGNQSTVTIT